MKTDCLNQTGKRSDFWIFVRTWALSGMTLGVFAAISISRLNKLYASITDYTAALSLFAIIYAVIFAALAMAAYGLFVIISAPGKTGSSQCLLSEWSFSLFSAACFIIYAEMWLADGIAILPECVNILLKSINNYPRTTFLVAIAYAAIIAGVTAAFTLTAARISPRKAEKLQKAMRDWGFPSFAAILIIAHMGFMKGSGIFYFLATRAITQLLIIMIAALIAFAARGILAMVSPRMKAWHLVAFVFLISSAYFLSARFQVKYETSKMEKETQAINVRATGLKVMLIGIDSARWELAQPLIDKGQMPNLKRLIENGTRADLISEVPILSPRIWTTIITGKPPEEHGITDTNVYILPLIPNIRIFPRNSLAYLILHRAGLMRITPITSGYRRVKALWNILSGVNKSAGVVGWLWAGWPAERVNGYIVTREGMASLRGMNPNSKHRKYGVSYPSGLAYKMAPLLVGENELDTERLFGVKGYTKENFAYLSRITGFEPEVFNWHLVDVRDDQNMFNIFNRTTKARPTDFSAVYFRSLDTAGHYFYRYFKPGLDWKYKPKPEATRMFNQVINGHYRMFDAWLGGITRDIPPDTVVIICSDHGMTAATDDNRNRSGEHTIDGIFLISGGPALKGRIIKDRSIYDIAPTILYLLGLPTPDDMPGKIIKSAIEPGFINKFQPSRVATYEYGPTLYKRNIVNDKSVTDKQIEMLRSLQYIK